MPILEQVRVADVLEWHEKKQLLLNPHFQRRAVWSMPAKVYLIDTILRDMPIPKVFIRTKVDLLTKKSFREVVDGQQRLRAIIEFAEDAFALTKRAAEYEGLHYSTLEPEAKQRFLSYPIAVEQLINASDDMVLEVFARLNSYTITLNDPEKRHAKFQGAFKWAIHDASRSLSWFWERYTILTLRQRSRMNDDSLTAELVGILLKGVTDGGEGNITKMYREYELDEPPFAEHQESTIARLSEVMTYIDDNLGEAVLETPLAKRFHFVVLFAAISHALFGISKGQLEVLPPRNTEWLSDLAQARGNLVALGDLIEVDEVPRDRPSELQEFWNASIKNPHRIARRRVRFPIFLKALLPRPVDA